MILSFLWFCQLSSFLQIDFVILWDNISLHPAKQNRHIGWCMSPQTHSSQLRCRLRSIASCLSLWPGEQVISAKPLLKGYRDLRSDNIPANRRWRRPNHPEEKQKRKVDFFIHDYSETSHNNHVIANITTYNMQSCATETDLQWHWEKCLSVKNMQRQHKYMSRRLCQSPAIPIILSNHPSEWSMEQKDLHNTVQKKGENSMFILRHLASKSEPWFKYRQTTGVRNEENHATKVWCMNWILMLAQKILEGKQKFAIKLSSTNSRASHQVHANWHRTHHVNRM